MSTGGSRRLRREDAAAEANPSAETSAALLASARKRQTTTTTARRGLAPEVDTQSVVSDASAGSNSTRRSARRLRGVRGSVSPSPSPSPSVTTRAAARREAEKALREGSPSILDEDDRSMVSDDDYTRPDGSRALRRSGSVDSEIVSDYSFSEEEKEYKNLEISRQEAETPDVRPPASSAAAVNNHLAFVIARFIANFYRQTTSAELFAYLGVLLTGACAVALVAGVALSSRSAGGTRPVIPVFEPPASAPKDAYEAMMRLLDLETNLDMMSAAFGSIQADYLKYYAEKSERFDAFESEVGAAMTAQSGRFETLYEETAAAAGDTEAAFGRLDESLKKVLQQYEGMQSDISKLSYHLTDISETTDAEFADYTDKLETVYTRLDSMKSSIGQVKDRLDGQELEIGNLATSVSARSDRMDGKLAKMVDAAQETAVQAIERLLPERVPVRVQDNGELAVDPSFYKYLQAAFATQEEAKEACAQAEETKHTVLEKLAFWKRREQGADRTEQQQQRRQQSTLPRRDLTWSEFLEKNEKSLQTYIDREYRGWIGQLDEREIFVDKDTVVDVIRKEMDKVKSETARRLRESEQELDEVVQEKIPKTKRNAQILADASAAAAAGQPVTKGSANLTQTAVETLVEEVLQRYHDGLEMKVDYADVARDARVNPFVTSPTFIVGGKAERSLMSLVWSQIRQMGEEYNPELTSGDCWPFEGTSGVLGIRLASPIFLTEVAIKHVPFGSPVAPKDFEVWAEIKDDEERAALQQKLHDLDVFSRPCDDDDEDCIPEQLSKDSSVLLSLDAPNFIKLGRFRYENNGPLHLQSFRFPAAAAQSLRRVPVSNVVFKFDSNWGDPDATCVYKTLVHGVPLYE
ncbi:hypothetical protein BZA70DRAFT_75124 [Myxozyma melibiosi]|uniref:SUN domain-containing protein n=1 Tax=Myxozyma melibiosi TaxID=54550 RepID=A0ABR1F0B4_9ASCO